MLTALAYPNEEKEFNRDEMIDVLKQVSLGHLQDRLDQEQDWTRILSLGEQQRLAFARCYYISRKSHSWTKPRRVWMKA